LSAQRKLGGVPVDIVIGCIGQFLLHQHQATRLLGKLAIKCFKQSVASEKSSIFVRSLGYLAYSTFSTDFFFLQKSD
jgi:hypothetical protein